MVFPSLLVSRATFACHSTYPGISRGREGGSGGRWKQNATSSYLGVPDTMTQRKGEGGWGHGCFQNPQALVHLSDLVSSTTGTTVYLAQRGGANHLSRPPRRRSRAHSPTHLLLCSHLFLLRRKSMERVEKGREGRKKEVGGKGRKIKEN